MPGKTSLSTRLETLKGCIFLFNKRDCSRLTIYISSISTCKPLIFSGRFESRLENESGWGPERESPMKVVLEAAKLFKLFPSFPHRMPVRSSILFHADDSVKIVFVWILPHTTLFTRTSSILIADWLVESAETNKKKISRTDRPESLNHESKYCRVFPSDNSIRDGNAYRHRRMKEGIEVLVHAVMPRWLRLGQTVHS